MTQTIKSETGKLSNNAHTVDNLLPMVAAALSPRRRQVARLLLCGLGDRAIGKTLGISHNTVKSHITKLRKRAGISSRTNRGRRIQLVMALLARS